MNSGIFQSSAKLLESSPDAGASRRTLRFIAIAILDGVFTVVSFYLAYLVRFDGAIPAEHWRNLLIGLPILVSLRVVLNGAFGIHRWSFRMSGMHEAVRLSFACLSGSALFVALFSFFQRFGAPRSVIILEFFFTTAAMAIFRFSPRLAWAWWVDQKRSKREGVRRTLIIGAGGAGDLLLRDLLRSREHAYHVVAFVDDDASKIGMSLGGRPILGPIDRLPELVERMDISQVLIAVPRMPADRIRDILSFCSNVRISFKIIPVSFTYLNDRITAAMLLELSPEDLLQRHPTAFNTREISALVSGRRILITGAAGSIGSEIARQVSSYGPESLVLADMNENDLYFLYRALREKHPELKVHAEVADIRDGTRCQRLGQQYRPQYVFHAAAHKHVPLMEDAPDEAVKNNVFGTLNVASMADLCGAERFVLISTDKAVHPSSVMGATKRVAELVVREHARRSATRFTAVRFGNVLGSAGSVVPLFKQQIKQGGRVTVTHPDCTRYFMTIPEAVGLVLVTGLGNYGDLCILDMGEAIKIVDLAKHMITMAGLVPGTDVKIEFTGLRPGEKLSEELMSEEEEQTQSVRDKVFAVKSPPPPRDLAEALADLRLQAESGDREAILRALRRLVPTFQATQALREASERPSGAHRRGLSIVTN